MTKPRSGQWFLLEGLEAASPALLAMLSPLLEGRPLPPNSSLPDFDPHPGFRLVATMTSLPRKHVGGSSHRGAVTGGGLQPVGGWWCCCAKFTYGA